MLKKRAKNKHPRQSDWELRILNVLWKNGPSTVRSVFEQFEAKTGVGYTTILKYLQIMHEKKLVSRDESNRSHVYAAAISRDDMQDQIVDDLLDTVFDGSRKRLVMRILSQTQASPQELLEIQKLLAQTEQES